MPKPKAPRTQKRSSVNDSNRRSTGHVPLMMGLGKEREYFIENLSTLLASGMDISAALDAVRSGTQSRAMQRIITTLKENVDAGSPLWSALNRTRVLPEHVTSLIRIGEESGRLSDNLAVVVNQQRKDRVFHSKILSAMMYPALVVVLAIVMSLGISWFVLPRLASVFASLNVPLPLITRVLIVFGRIVDQYGSIIIPSILAVLVALWLVLFVFSRTKHIGQWILFHLPGVHTLIQQVELARFGFILGTLLAAGLTVPRSLESLRDTTSMKFYRSFYEYLRAQAEEGTTFRQCFALYPHLHRLIPSAIQQMIIAAERSGRMAEIMRRIGDTFEQRAETTTKNLSVLMEPLLLVMVWMGVVGVALAVILPVYSILGGLNR